MEKPVVRNVAKKKKPCTLGKHSPIDNSHISRVADTMIMNVPRLESVNNLSATGTKLSPSPYSRKRWQINLLTNRIEANA